MTNLNYEEQIDKYIPNFRRFEDALDADSDIIVDIALLIKKTYDAWLLEIIWKHINLELGLCIMKDNEIDRDKIKEILKTLKY